MGEDDDVTSSTAPPRQSVAECRGPDDAQLAAAARDHLAEREVKHRRLLVEHDREQSSRRTAGATGSRRKRGDIVATRT